MKALLIERVIEMTQARFWAVVIRPLPLRRINRRQRRLGQGLLGFGELLLQPSDLLMALAQLLQRIHQSVGVNSR